MYKKLGYAKYDGNVIWEVVCDNGDGTVDLNIDDLQGDMTLCCVDKKDITFVDEKDYKFRIAMLE